MNQGRTDIVYQNAFETEPLDTEDSQEPTVRNILVSAKPRRLLSNEVNSSFGKNQAEKLQQIEQAKGDAQLNIFIDKSSRQIIYNQQQKNVFANNQNEKSQSNNEITVKTQENGEGKIPSNQTKFKKYHYQTVLPQMKKVFMDLVMPKIKSMKKAILAQIFTDKIKEKSEKYRLRNLQEHDYAMIDDPSISLKEKPQRKQGAELKLNFFDDATHHEEDNNNNSEIPYYLKPEMQEREQELFMRLKNNKFVQRLHQSKLPIIDINSTFLQYWKIYMLMITPLITFMMTVETAVPFRFHENIGNNWDAIVIITGLSFIAQALIQLNVAYYDCGQLIVDKRTIRMNYLRKNFIIDVLAIWGLFESLFRIFETGNGWQNLNFLILLKVMDWSEMMQQITEMMQIKNHIQGVRFIRIIRLVIMILFVGHFLSLIHLTLHQIELENGIQSTFFNQIPQTLDGSWFQIYSWIFYWNIVTMTTVGYGDICPLNYMEALVQCLVMMFAVGFYSYAFGLVGALIQTIHDQEIIFSGKMSQMTQYFREKNVPYGVQALIRNYYSYLLKNNIIHQNQEQEDEEILNIINELGPNIQKALEIVINIQYLKKCKFLKENFSEELLEALTHQCYSANFQQDDIIINPGWFQSSINLYFIEKGEVEIFLKQNDDEKPLLLAQLKQGSPFNLVNFIFEKENKYQIIASQDSRILVLKKKDFISTLRDPFFKADFEFYNQLKEKMIHRQDISTLEVECFVCQQVNHDFTECPRNHYTPSKTLIISRYLKQKNYRQDIVNDNIDQQQKINHQDSFAYGNEDVFKPNDSQRHNIKSLQIIPTSIIKSRQKTKQQTLHRQTINDEFQQNLCKQYIFCQQNNISGDDEEQNASIPVFNLQNLRLHNPSQNASPNKEKENILVPKSQQQYIFETFSKELFEIKLLIQQSLEQRDQSNSNEPKPIFSSSNVDFNAIEDDKIQNSKNWMKRKEFSFPKSVFDKMEHFQHYYKDFNIELIQNSIQNETPSNQPKKMLI